MRKTVLLFIFFCFVGSVYAQKLQFGLKFNPNIGWFKVDDKTYIENKGIGLGFSYGLTLDYHFQNNVALNIEPSQLFYNPSTEATDTISNAKIDTKWEIRYIAIPLALKMTTSQMGKFKYYGKIGFSTGIKTSAKIEDKEASTSVAAMDFAVIIGGGLQYSLGGSTALLFGATFHNGVIRINTDDSFKDAKTLGLETFSLEHINLKSSFITLDIGILF
jgi:hypothetical protein